MPTNSLTDAKCRAAKGGPKPIKLFDGGGLHLWISSSGAKSWRWSYRVNGKPQTMSFGPYPDVSLQQARARRDEEKAKLRTGEDPMAVRRAERKGITLREASNTYWQGRRDITDDYRTNALHGIERHLGPLLGDRNIGTITRADLLTALNAMDAAGLGSYVRKVRMWVSQVFEWAVEQRFASINPAALIRPEKAFSKTTTAHFAAVELGEVPELLRRLSLEGRLQSVLALRMLAYTWTRTVELRMMEWSEVSADLWRVPGAKMKRKKDLLVPLPRQALALLAELKPRCRGSRYVFPAEHRIDRPMSENTVLYLLYRMGYKGRMTGHGWRTVASTWANENGFKADAIERQLSHTPEDKVRAAYNRAEYMPDRRAMLQAWADWLDSCEIDPSSAQGR
jgi:integrase